MTGQVLSWLACEDKDKEHRKDDKEEEEELFLLKKVFSPAGNAKCAKQEVPHYNKTSFLSNWKIYLQHPPFNINIRHLFSSEECIIFQHHFIGVPYNYAQFICLWFPRRDVQSWSRKGHVHREHIHPHFQFSLHKQLHIYRCIFIQQAPSYKDVSK
jgi:hypothetical protein